MALDAADRSMLIPTFTTLPPAMTLAEAVETPRLHSLAGCTGGPAVAVTVRPLPARHHTITDVERIDGGCLTRPGGVSLALMAISTWMDSRVQAPRA
jgi:magnesium chelatase family protein